MDSAVFLVVIASAFMQAGWNVMLKARRDPFSALVVVNAGAGLTALPFALWLGPPPADVWPWIAASVPVHTAYYALLAAAYNRADLGQAYPIARGTALLLAVAFSVLALHERIGPIGLAGVVLLGTAVLIMSWHRATETRFSLAGVALALGAGLAIATYTVLDGLAARATGSVNLYTAWLFVGDGVFITTLALAWKGRHVRTQSRGFLVVGFGGGAMVLASYWLSVWAMTQASIGLVTAVRESSVLFGAAMSVLILREPFRVERLVASVLVLAGLALVKLH